ncbi:hypothetical protein [Mangrovicoccus sp. HB161399]|uniref:hypothetical protein n=1 Tax=Mangrovicoccus sp. HB161399 TaxID=2720392 RepID=UPI001554F0B6|nr:hypothetical protein [Mangrovicoccus sp. HB161399]
MALREPIEDAIPCIGATSALLSPKLAPAVDGARGNAAEVFGQPGYLGAARLRLLALRMPPVPTSAGMSRSTGLPAFILRSTSG